MNSVTIGALIIAAAYFGQSGNTDGCAILCIMGAAVLFIRGEAS